MKTVKTNPLSGVFNFFQTLASDNPYPDKQITTKLENITIDTSLPKDTKIWETGIKRAKIEGEWVIVEQYHNEAEAKEGHAKWVKLLAEYPDFPLKDIDIWGLDDMEGKND